MKESWVEEVEEVGMSMQAPNMHLQQQLHQHHHPQTYHMVQVVLLASCPAAGDRGMGTVLLVVLRLAVLVGAGRVLSQEAWVVLRALLDLLLQVVVVLHRGWHLPALPAALRRGPA